MMTVCAICGQPLKADGPMGLVHPETGSMYGPDGHLVVPLSEVAYEVLGRE